MQKNYAFIDAQNIHLAIQEKGWRIDWKRFRTYLKDKYLVEKAYIFLGYISRNKKLYKFLRESGFHLIFKEILTVNGKIKGNVDVEMAVQSLIEISNYHQALVVSNDGDFSYLIQYLIKMGKLRMVLSTHRKKTSFLLKKAAGGRIGFFSDIKETLQ